MNYFHALNRGVEKRSIAQDDRDRVRFVQSLYTLNDTRPAEHSITAPDIGYRDDDRERLVTIHAWCLMGNHYHLLLSEQTDGGISAFLQKLNIGYTRYFNLRHKRSGVLFQGKTKRVRIATERHYLYILPYIHLNPLDFMNGAASWRTQCLSKPKGALAWIANYRWSSYRNYIGVAEFAPILAGSEFFSDRKMHTRELERYLQTAPDNTLATLRLE